jgi:uncharacterized membrane protein YcaP (DUF421 family)
MNEYMLIIVRTLFLYFLILLVFRFMGKREIGQLSVFDLVINIMIAELAVIAIESPRDPIGHSIMPIILLMAVQISLAMFSMKSKKFRDLIDGSPTVIINKGKIDENAMRKQRYNMDDLLLQLREKQIRNLADVEFAILEPSGKLSVFEKVEKDGDITLPLIIDGKVQHEHLRRIEKSELWLKQQLKAKGLNEINRISFCSFQNGDFYIDLMD